MTTRRRARHLAATVTLLAALAGCAAEPQVTPPEQEDEAAVDAGYEIVMDDGLDFEPEVLTVPAGSVVEVVNRSSRAHSMQSEEQGPTGFDTGPVPAGDTVELVFDEPGRYPYHCRFHPDVMDGVIVVE